MDLMSSHTYFVISQMRATEMKIEKKKSVNCKIHKNRTINDVNTAIADVT